VKPPVPAEARAAAEQPEPSVLHTLRGLKDGSVNPKALAPEHRQACVAHLWMEGLSVPEMAELFKCHERTITRDRREIERKFALQLDENFAPRIAGQLMVIVEQAIQQIRRAARGADVPKAVKIDASFKTVQIYDIAIQRLQSMGFASTAPGHLEGRVRLEFGQIPDYQQIAQQVEACRRVVAETMGGDPGAVRVLNEVDDAVKRASLANRAELLASVPSGPPAERST
jgi:hypothetical protein